MIWTTTPWTLPANVAAAVKPDAEYGRRENGEWVAVGALSRTRRSSSAKRGEELVGWRYQGPFDELGPGARGRAPRDPVGRGHARRGHRASSTSRPAAAARTSSSRRCTSSPVLTPVDEAGRFYDDYGWLHGLSTVEAADQIIG